jgi:hypothetical protein
MFMKVSSIYYEPQGAVHRDNAAEDNGDSKRIRNGVRSWRSTDHRFRRVALTPSTVSSYE